MSSFVSCTTLSFLLFLLTPLLTFAATDDAALSIPEFQQQLGLPHDLEPQWTEVPLNETSGADSESPFIRQLRVMHLGDGRFLFRVDFSSPPHFGIADLQLAVNLDGDEETGSRIINRPGIEGFFRVVNQTVASRALGSDPDGMTLRALQYADRVYAVIDDPTISTQSSHQSIRVFGRGSNGHPASNLQVYVGPQQQIPTHHYSLPPFAPSKSSLVLPLSSFRTVTNHSGYDDQRVNMGGRQHGLAFDRLQYKGLRGEQAQPAEAVPMPRPRPVPLFTEQITAAAILPPSLIEDIPVQLHNESNTDRSARIRFGLPFAEGQLWSTHSLELLDELGKTITNAQIQATVPWPDGSIRWAIANAELELAARGLRQLTVTSSAAPSDTASPIWREDDHAVYVDTGQLQATISKEQFRPIDVTIENKHTGTRKITSSNGFQLTAEDGARFSSAALPPDSVRIEEDGPAFLTLRIEGSYGNESGSKLQRYVTRLSFRRGSPRVYLQHTHINDNLQTEFTDIQSLTLPLQFNFEANLAQTALDPSGQVIEQFTDPSFQLRQWTDRSGTVETDTLTTTFQRTSGAIRVGNDKSAIGVVIEDFWQRWPKGYQLSGDQLTIELLPLQPADTWAQDLPPHLRFPFVEGHYRTKWGTAFTERILFDFSGGDSIEALSAEGQQPVVPTLPAEIYANTAAFGDVAAGDSEIAKQWDDFFERSFKDHLQRREQQREYGFLNYGDWFGERARNWGNNEYDTAHAFFSQFARTGDTRYFRAALAAARHQADVDTVHAHPDPRIIGGNIIHSVFHGGTTSHFPSHGLWSADLTLLARGSNGHTWSEGMTEAWFLAADAPVMEAALAQGEHLAHVMAPEWRYSERRQDPRSPGWALRSLMALYRATADPVYLDAGRQLAYHSLEGQHPNGGWFYDMPVDRAAPRATVQRTPGHMVFQFGVLLGALKEYHRASQDADIEAAMITLAEICRDTWEINDGGWPYMITPERTRHPGSGDGFSYSGYIYTADGMAYVGRVLLQDPEYLEFGGQALQDILDGHEVMAVGQRIGWTLRAGNNLLSEIFSAQQTAP